MYLHRGNVNLPLITLINADLDFQEKKIAVFGVEIFMSLDSDSEAIRGCIYNPNLWNSREHGLISLRGDK